MVDGSNLATEGRTAPSLTQLDEAVRAYAAEDPDASIIVVVDATFEHRVSESEREEVREAMLNGELISPPAGAIGRGDAFVLRIAARTGATVLSNDSFQEFHGEHPWLFDEGRLVGGKPVPGVGWIFTPRLPIRGPKSRAATAEARAKRDFASAPAKAAELAKAAKKAAKKTAKATKAATPAVDTSWPLVPTIPPPGRVRVDPLLSIAIDEAVEEALHPPTPGRAKTGAARAGAAPKSAKSKRDVAEAAHGEAHPGDGAAGPDGARPGGRRSRKKRTAPPPAVNEPLAFINFVAAYPLGSTLEGEVVSFTSHGAMVDVSLPDGGVLHCYIPLSAMGDPLPTKARQVLTKGETRPFVLAGLDPPRRVAELALPAASTSGVAASAPGPAAGPPAATGSTGTGTSKKVAKKAAAPAKKAVPPAKKAAAPVKKAVKKAAKKTTAGSKKAAKRVDGKAAKKVAEKTEKAAKRVAEKSTKKTAEKPAVPSEKASGAAKVGKAEKAAAPRKKAARRAADAKAVGKVGKTAGNKAAGGSIAPARPR